MICWPRITQITQMDLLYRCSDLVLNKVMMGETVVITCLDKAKLL